MGWQSILIIVVAAVLVATISILIFLYVRARKKYVESLSEIERLKARCEGARDQARQLMDMVESRELDDEEAYAEIISAVSGWSPVNPPGIPDDGQ